MTEKYKIWDTQNKQWFRPTYPGFRIGKNYRQVEHKETEEIFFSQSGEIYLRKNDGTDPLKNELTHYPLIQDRDGKLEGRFIACLFTGIKDKLEIKTYQHDLVEADGWKGKVTFLNGAWQIVWIDYAHFPSVLLHATTFRNLGSSLEQ